MNLNIIYKPAFIEPLNHASPAHPRAIWKAQTTDIVLYHIHCAIVFTDNLIFPDLFLGFLTNPPKSARKSLKIPLLPGKILG